MNDDLPVAEDLALSSQDLELLPEEAVDVEKSRRPGNPMEREPAPVANAHWREPDQQPVVPGLLVERSRKLTATFGTQHPPRGLSGVLRRAAYQLPDYRVRRWAMLMLADRVDAIESNIAESVKKPIPWLVLVGAVGLLLQLRRRPRRFAWR